MNSEIDAPPTAPVLDDPPINNQETLKQERDRELVDLIARCAIKEQKALKLLYERCSAYLNGVAYRIVRSKETSNEVLQEAFIQIWEKAASYRSYLSSPLTWMTSIVRYRALDRLAFDQRRGDIAVDMGESLAHQHGDSDGSPEDYVHQCQLSSELHECLAQLNEPMRQSIELAYLYGYSREEIASTLDSKINTVKSWLFRGAKLLKECLNLRLANE